MQCPPAPPDRRRNTDRASEREKESDSIANPALFLDEMQAKLRKDVKLKVSVSFVCRYLHRAVPAGLGYTLQILERRALQKDYIERSNFLRIIDSVLYPSSQMIFVESESLAPLQTYLCMYIFIYT